MAVRYKKFISQFLGFLPVLLLLYFSASEISTQFKFLRYLSFNIQFIIIYYWVLRSPKNLPYGLIFISGILNDVVLGSPIGLSALSFLVLAGFAAYVRNVTVRSSWLTDWLPFLPAILFTNTVYICATLAFSNFILDYFALLINSLITFVIFPFMWIIFEIFKNSVKGTKGA